jgi:SAM-dependent methyltransferase
MIPIPSRRPITRGLVTTLCGSVSVTAYRHFRNGGAIPPPDRPVGRTRRRARRILEVGSGFGHWTRTIAPHLSRGSRLTAIDSDPKWADSNGPWLRLLATQGLEVTIERAGAEAIPFPDAEFDFVTCQTVLIHVADPGASIAEMLRVLKPGGLFLCAEPDNFGTYAAATSLSGCSSLEDEVAAFKFNLAQQRGRKALGYGDASLGGVLPGVLVASGLTDVQVHLSKCRSRASLSLRRWRADVCGLRPEMSISPPKSEPSHDRLSRR